MRIAVLSLVILAAGACAAAAQTDAPRTDATQADAPKPDSPGAAAKPRDPIAALLSRDEDEPDFAGQRRGAAGPDFDLTAPIPAPSGPPIPFAAAPRSQREIPVNVDQPGQTPDGPPDNRAQAYDARIRGSFAAAQSFQGPLDGGWTLTGRGWRYNFQIVDRRDRLEAVWRNPERAGALDASGVVDAIERNGSTLTLSFDEKPYVVARVTLHSGPDGRWSGEMWRGDERFAVTLERTSP